MRRFLFSTDVQGDQDDMMLSLLDSMFRKTNSSSNNNFFLAGIDASMKQGGSLSEEPLTILALTVYSLVSLVAIIGNLAFCLVIWRSQKLRTITHLLMTNLGLANLTFAILNPPIFITRYILRTDWILGEALCKICSSVLYLTTTVSFYAIALVAADRWFAVFQQQRRLDLKMSIILTVIVWLIGFAITAPYLVFFTVDRSPISILSNQNAPIRCGLVCENCLVPLELATVTIQYILPLTVILPCYIHLCVFLASRKDIGSEDRQRRAHM